MNIYKFMFLVSISCSAFATKDSKDKLFVPIDIVEVDTTVVPAPPIDPKPISEEDKKLVDKTARMPSIKYYLLKHMHDVQFMSPFEG